MIRWVFVLVLGLGACLAILGQDHGQRRAGLANAPALAVVVAASFAEPTVVPKSAKPEPAKPVLFAPTQPLIAAPDPKLTEVAEQIPAPVAAPAPALPQLFARRAVVLRSGAGRYYPVVAMVNEGANVSVLADDNPAFGWRHVQMQTGETGFVAAKLMAAGP